MSPLATNDATVTALEQRRCGWCRSVMTTIAGSSRRRFCSRRCRQSAFRLRQRCADFEATASPGAFHYADPPYPGTSAKYYRDEPTFAGEVDFPALIASLRAARDTGACLGWALSTSARSLRDLLPLCPPEARVCAWVKPIGVSVRTFGIHSTWEPVIVVGGRQRQLGKRDWLRAMPARGEGTLPGRKPIAFCAWLFELLGMQPGDTLVDVFPGTGIVGRAWAELSSGAAVTSRSPRPSLTPASATSSQVLDDASSTAAVSLAAVDDGASLVDEHDGRAILSPTAGAGRQSLTLGPDVAQVPGRLSLLEETTEGVVQADRRPSTSAERDGPAVVAAAGARR